MNVTGLFRKRHALRAPYLLLFELSAAMMALRAVPLSEVVCDSVLALCLLFLAVSDWEQSRIPNQLLFIPAACRVVFLICTAGWRLLPGSLSGAAFLILIMALISHIGGHLWGVGCFGGGDIKLFGLAGLYLGAERGLWCAGIACMIGLITALAVHRSRFPFGPSISSAIILCLLLPG